MNIKKLSCVLSLTLGLLTGASAMADEPKLEFPAPSPGCTLKQRVGLTDIEVNYSRPSLKDREVFGPSTIVPYGKVWRTGANQATKIIFSTPVKINGNDIPAGTYSLFTIPDKDEWTVMINKGPAESNPSKYDAKDDVVRFQVKPKNISYKMETLTIELNDIRDLTAHLDILWDKVKIPLELQVEDYADKLAKRIDAEMSSSDPKKPYFQAAAFYYNHGLDLKKAHEWVDAALKERDAHFIAYLKAQILEKQGDKKGALEAARHSNELAAKANDNAYIKQSADLITKLQ